MSKRRVKAKLRDAPLPATQGNQTWAMPYRQAMRSIADRDFVHRQLATGRKIRILTVVDTVIRFSPGIDPRFGYRGEDVVQTLERICWSIGYPRAVRVDLWAALVSRDLDL